MCKPESSHLHTLRPPVRQISSQTRHSQKMFKSFLGHSDVSITINVYVHATKEVKRSSAKIMNKVLEMY